jgi:hypothetical protein
MSPPDALDAHLLALATAPRLRSFEEVIERLGALDDALPPSDGLRYFNRLYLTMTEAVVAAARRGEFQDLPFLERLDCTFADLYLAALAAHLSIPGTAPGAWRPLFAGRHRRDLAPIQLALAGVNAHINRDLPVALQRTFVELGTAPDRGGAAHGDYARIDEILEVAQAEAKVWLLTGALAELDRAFGPHDDVVQIWSLGRAREAAWIAGEIRWTLRAAEWLCRAHLESLDRMVGFASRGLLRPLRIVPR